VTELERGRVVERGDLPLHRLDDLAARVAELEALCTDVLTASSDAGLPQPLLNRLKVAVARGESLHAREARLPSASPAAPLSAAVTSPPVADLPLPPAALASGPVPSSELMPLSITKTVVVVDDDAMMLNVLGRIFERENFHLVMASSGPAALQAIQGLTMPVDLLVTDYAMPGMQGRELADRVRERFPLVRVLYQTGFSDLLFENCIELEEGAAFVEKPFTARGLREAARMLLFGTLNPA
jgi:CheY-like chemotaxis protein